MYKKRCPDVSTGSTAVRGLFWAQFLWGLTQGDSHFKHEDHSGSVVIRSLVFSVSIQGCLQNGSGVNPGLWIQKKTHLVVIRRPKCDFPSYCSLETFFFVIRPLIYFDTWILKSSWFLREFEIREWLFRRSSSWLYLLMPANFVFFVTVALFEEKKTFSCALR